jgi:hypothetical protein
VEEVKPRNTKADYCSRILRKSVYLLRWGRKTYISLPDAMEYTNFILMTTVEKQNELRDRIIDGLKIAYQRLIEFKKQKKTDLVILKDNKIIRVKPE